MRPPARIKPHVQAPACFARRGEDGVTTWPFISRGALVFVTVDDAGAALLTVHRWRIHPDGRTHYVRRNGPRDDSGRRSTVLLHRELMQPASDMQVDHKDCDGLNNRRANLREATHAENTWNRRMHKRTTTGFKGVYRQRGLVRRPYVALICVRGEHISLG